MKGHEYYYLAKKNLLPDAAQRVRTKGVIKKDSRVHVSAVCGKAMASVACLLKEYGCEVSGSDKAFLPPMSGVLEAHKIKCLPFSKENLKQVDIVVAGNAMTPSDIEVVEAQEKNIPMISGGEVLGQIFSDKRALVVAGTHGKTTVSGFLTHVFLESGQEPAYLIGGVFQKSDNSYSIGGTDSKFVIYEGDEYNSAFFDRGPKFLQYNPTSAIITSIEHDHIDLYPTFEDYKQAFQFLAEELPEDGFLVVHESAVKYLRVSNLKAKVIVYGSNQSSDAYYEIKETNVFGTVFSLFIKARGEINNIQIPLFGEYNVSNAAAVFAISLLEGILEEKILKSMENFSGTKERQELLGVKDNGVQVIKDYAHHPTAVTLTLEALKLRYPNKRLVAVFEPRSASSKRKVFEERYGEALKKADTAIIISPTLKPADDSKDLLNVLNVKRMLDESGRPAYNSENVTEALETLLKISSPDDVVVFMSSGDIDGMPNKFLEL